MRVIDQTQRRVFRGESVPAGEKVFSLFETHTDIIIKGHRDIQYGHKLNLSSGKSELILGMVVEEGNPADTDRLLPMLERHINQYGCAPKQWPWMVAMQARIIFIRPRPVASRTLRSIKSADCILSGW